MKGNKKIVITVLVVILVFAMASTAFASGGAWGSEFPVRSTNHIGSDYASVRLIQKQINNFNAYSGSISEDGKFGSGTKNAVTNFQRNRGLSSADGIVGSKTWAALQARNVQKTGWLPRYYVVRDKNNNVRSTVITGAPDWIWQVRISDHDWRTIEGQ